MATFRLFSSVENTLEDIWSYSYGRWGEEQANRYIHDLYRCMDQLAANRLRWRETPQSLCVPRDITHKVYFHHHQRHYVFFRELQAGDIGILSIVHDAMDVPVRLARDLEALPLK